MLISDAELTGLAAICGDGRLLGVPVLSGGQQAAMDAMKGLQEKGVLDQQGGVTSFGRVPIRSVEDYRRADRHVFINQLKLSINDDGAVTVLHPAPEGWNLARMNPLAVMVILLRMYPFLCRGGDEAPTGEWGPLTRTQWAHDRSDKGAHLLMVVRHTSQSQRSSVTIVYDTRGDRGFAYDMDAGLGRSLPVWEIRCQVAALLGCVPGFGMGVGRG